MQVSLQSGNSCMHLTSAERHNRYQRQYFAHPEAKPAMRPGRSPYVLRHLEAALAALEPAPGAHLLELGCGMGRFTELLLERGFRVTAVDLSPDLLGELEAAGPRPGLRCLCCDAAEVHQHLEKPVDGALGFFFLHHLERLEPALASLREGLRPGGRLAFCEPNGWNPLFYLQILLTPGMSFRGERGLYRMRPGAVEAALRQAGFQGPRTRTYGLLPPALANTRWGAAMERRLERWPLPLPVRAFHAFSAER